MSCFPPSPATSCSLAIQNHTPLSFQGQRDSVTMEPADHSANDWFLPPPGRCARTLPALFCLVPDTPSLLHRHSARASASLAPQGPWPSRAALLARAASLTARTAPLTATPRRCCRVAPAEWAGRLADRGERSVRAPPRPSVTLCSGGASPHAPGSPDTGTKRERCPPGTTARAPCRTPPLDAPSDSVVRFPYRRGQKRERPSHPCHL